MIDLQSSSSILYDYPERAAFGRVIPKTRFYAARNPGQRIKKLFTQQIGKIIWQYKLSPETLNIKANRAMTEIQIISIILKPNITIHNLALPEDVLRCIDKAINFPIIFEIKASSGDNSSPDWVKMAATYKRPSEADKDKWVIGDYFSSDWLPSDTDRVPLPVTLDLLRLYEQLIKPLIPMQARKGEAIGDLAERQRQAAIIQRECQRLETSVHREKQFNRKVELNQQLRDLKAELVSLTQLINPTN